MRRWGIKSYLYRRAPQYLDDQLKTAWRDRLAPFAQRLNPLREEIFGKFHADYYWTVNQCEWATDIVFRPGALDRLSPRFLEHGMLNFSSLDLMRFLGKALTPTGRIPAQFAGQIATDFKRRQTGERVKTTNQMDDPIDDLRAFRP